MTEVGNPIYPRDLGRILGNGFFTSVQISKLYNVDQKSMDSTLYALCDRGYLEEWGAPKCTLCGYVWPEFCVEENDYPSDVECPICNKVSLIEETTVYEVFKVIKTLP
mgnify:CR=1 FL=1